MKIPNPSAILAGVFVCLTSVMSLAAVNNKILVVPTSINFTNELTSHSSSARTITVTNVSSLAVTVNGDFVSPSKFSVTGPTFPFTLQPGNSQAFSVTFSPGTSTGMVTGQITFHTTDPVNPSTTAVALTGTGVSSNSAAMAIIPTTYAYGNQSVGVVTCGQPVTVSNGGSANVSFSNVTITGPFNVSTFSPSSISPGGSASATVNYTPQAPGQSDSGTLSVTMSNGAQRSVSLTGTGVQTNWNADPKIPLIDMGTANTTNPRKYMGFEGGLYDGGCNSAPPDHDATGRAFAAMMQPLDTGGNPSSSGKIILLSIGMSNAIKEWCGLGGAIGSCETGVNNSFMAQAAASASVEHTKVVILDGAASMQQATDWDSPSDPDYATVASSVLAPNYTEQQVQALWLKEVDITPTGTPSLPASNADAYTLETNLANIVRAAKVRYPNLRVVFLTSRIYGGFAVPDVTREPYAYETGYAVKMLVKAQIDQMRNGGSVVDTHAGDLDYKVSTSGGAPLAPWLVWERLNGTSPLTGSTYIWANSNPTANANSDGVLWPQNYFESDGQHPNTTLGIPQVGTVLLNYFLNSCYTKPWFLASPSSCQ